MWPGICENPLEAFAGSLRAKGSKAILVPSSPDRRKKERNAGTFVIKVVVMRKAGSARLVRIFTTNFNIVSEQSFVLLLLFIGRPHFRCAAPSRNEWQNFDEKRRMSRLSPFPFDCEFQFISFPRSVEAVHCLSQFRFSTLYIFTMKSLELKDNRENTYEISWKISFYYLLICSEF